MLAILAVTFPFFALVLCGYVVARRGWLPLDAIPGLNLFVLYLALPCMLFRFAAGTPITRMLDPGIVASYVGCALAMVAVTLVSTRRGATGWNDASFGGLVAAFPNSGFMGVPLLVDLLGKAAAGPAVVALSIDMVVTSSLCIALSRQGLPGTTGAAKAAGTALRGMAINPLPWSIFAGCLVSAWQIDLPAPLIRPVAMLAEAASPVALFTLGAVLARSRAAAIARPQRNPAQAHPGQGDVPLLVGYKLLLHPALMLACGWLARAAGLALDPAALTVLTVVAALPSASNVPMLAERFGADAGRIARIVLFSTAAAFVTFSAAVSLLQ